VLRNRARREAAGQRSQCLQCLKAPRNKEGNHKHRSRHSSNRERRSRQQRMILASSCCATSMKEPIGFMRAAMDLFVPNSDSDQ
jgi:hypothetical protein